MWSVAVADAAVAPRQSAHAATARPVLNIIASSVLKVDDADLATFGRDPQVNIGSSKLITQM
jgi:hypothetical protein